MHLSTKILIAMVAAIAATAPAQQLRDPYTGDVTEFVRTGPIDWNTAFNRAIARGGSLYSPRNANSFQWLRNNFRTNLTRYLPWVGAYANRPTYPYSPWYLVNGGNNAFINSPYPWNNRSATGGKEDRAHFWYDGLLNDISGNSVLPQGYIIVYRNR